MSGSPPDPLVGVLTSLGDHDRSGVAGAWFAVVLLAAGAALDLGPLPGMALGPLLGPSTRGRGLLRSSRFHGGSSRSATQASAMPDEGLEPPTRGS